MYVSENGDVLCTAAMTKGVVLARPTCILRGVGTQKLQSAIDLIVNDDGLLISHF